MSKTSSNENEFELINRDTDRTSTTNSHNDDNSNINYQDEADGISNRLKEQFSSNSLLGKSQFKNLIKSVQTIFLLIKVFIKRSICMQLLIISQV